MFPGIYEFRWDAGHLIFLGAFYTVFLVLAGVLAAALARGLADLRRGRAEEIRWHGDFSALPSSSRRCRHEIAGEISRRVCPNGFDCRICAGHAEFLRKSPAKGEAAEHRAPREESVFGFQMPQDRLYHRGHTWVRQEEDGTATIGLDDLGARLLGSPEELKLPAAGSRLRVNGTAFRIRSRGAEVRILSPLDGEVVEVGGPGRDWMLRIRPAGGADDFRHLLRGEEIRPWVMLELERLQAEVGRGTMSPMLADGGSPVADLSSAIPEETRDGVLGEIFLNP